MPDLIEVLKEIASHAQQAAKPVEFSFGQVTSVSPLIITVEQKLPLPGTCFFIPQRLTEHQQQVSVDWGTTVDGTHPHSHRTAGQLTMTLHQGLALGDKLLLLAVQQGQKYLVLDRVAP